MRPTWTPVSADWKYIVSSVFAAHRPHPSSCTPLNMVSNSAAGTDEHPCAVAASIAIGMGTPPLLGGAGDVELGGSEYCCAGLSRVGSGVGVTRSPLDK